MNRFLNLTLAARGSYGCKSFYKNRTFGVQAKMVQSIQDPAPIEATTLKPIKPSKWKRRSKFLIGLSVLGYGCFKAMLYGTTPKFDDDNFMINENMIDNLDYVGKHASEIKMDDIASCVAEMKQIYKSNITRKLPNRRKVLEDLDKLFNENSDAIVQALQKDLGRDKFFAVVSDVAASKGEIKHLLKNLEKYNAPKRAPMSIGTFPAIDYEIVEPYGTVFINAIWNFPFGTTFAPIAGAIAAGNNVVIKPCQTSTESSKLICDLLHKYVDSRFIQVIGHDTVGNDYEITDKILENAFDFIFFTGSSNGGRYILSKAAKHLTPVILELGGKNPVIIDDSADVGKASRQILCARTLNCGQMCISPDYVLCHANKMDEFMGAIEKTAYEWFEKQENEDEYVGKIVNKKQFERVVNMIENTNGEIVYGGKYDVDTLKVEPTIIKVDDWYDFGMREETFGPVLWVKSVENVPEAVAYINTKPKSLSLYMFSENKVNQNYVVHNTSAGGMQINGVAGYVANSALGFGGVGASGMGTYHGDKTFYSFCHKKPVVRNLSETTILYPPRTKDWILKYL